MNKNVVGLSISVMMLLTGCSVVGTVVVTPTATLTPPPAVTATLTPSSTDTPLPTPSPTDTPLPTPSPTDTLTPTPSQPVFNPAAFGDNRVLSSFILTKTDKTTGGGEVIETKDTIGYIKEPFSAYHLSTTSYGNPDGKYLIGGRFYQKNSTGDWSVSLEPDPTDIDYFLRSAADMREVYKTNFGVISAQFVGQEDFQGIPANHFTLDQSDLSEQSDPTGTYKIETAPGDLYLALDGNYLLYYHIKLTGNVYSPGGSPGYFPGVREFTEELTSINQLKDIAVPGDFLALKLELDLGLPLPAGTTLAGIVRYKNGLGVDYYHYTTPVSNAEFLEFYKNLAPTNGWTVSYIGEVAAHYVCDSQVCVILKKGDAQIILYHDQRQDATGTNYNFIGADYDKMHIYHPK